MATEKQVRITNHGMVNIPAPIRKRFGLKDGDMVWISDEEGDRIVIYPLETIDQLRADSFTTREILESLKQTHQEDLDREF